MRNKFTLAAIAFAALVPAAVAKERASLAPKVTLTADPYASSNFTCAAPAVDEYLWPSLKGEVTLCAAMDRQGKLVLRLHVGLTDYYVSSEWRNYQRVTKLGGDTMPMKKIDRLELGCSRYIGCRYYENLLIDISYAELDECQRGGMQMKVWGRISQELHITRQACRALGNWLASRGIKP